MGKTVVCQSELKRRQFDPGTVNPFDTYSPEKPTLA
jgi:hypothetical protein